jgi:hypothetical protein
MRTFFFLASGLTGRAIALKPAFLVAPNSNRLSYTHPHGRLCPSSLPSFSIAGSLETGVSQ